MIKRSVFQVLAVLAVAAIALAVWLSGQWQPGAEVDRATRAKLLPALAGNINDVTRLALVQGENRLVLKRQDEKWVVEQRHDYPADMKKLREVLIALADAEQLEAKTAKAELYPKLGVQHPASTTADADSMPTLIEIDSPAGKQAVIIGKAAPSSGKAMTYARVAEEPQSWLINGSFNVETEASRWLKQDVLNLGSPDISEVRIVQPDGSVVELSKSDRALPNFTLDNLPEGREMLSPSSGNSAASALGSLRLTDVKPAVEVIPDQTISSQYRTFDGLVVDVSAWQDGDDYWITLSASHEAPVVQQESAEETAVAESSIEQTEAETIRNTPEQVSARVDQINQLTEGWAYKIPSYKYGNMTRAMEDLLKPAESASQL